MKRSPRANLWVVLAAASAFLPMTGHAAARGSIPRLVNERELQTFEEWLEVTKEQAQEIKIMHVEYLQSWADQFNEDVQRFNAAWSAAHTNPRDFKGESMAALLKEANAIADRLSPRLEAANAVLFANVETVLTEKQRAMMQQVRLAHDRWSYRRPQYGVREKSIDIIEMVREATLSDDDRSSVEPVLAEFEPQFVSALKQSSVVERRRAIHEAEMLDLMRSQGDVADPEAKAQIDKIGDEAGRMSIKAAEHLVHVNRDGLRRVMSVLSPEAAADLQRRYLERAYPEVYPDPGSAVGFLERAIDLEDLDDTVRSALQAMQEAYLVDHVRLSRKMAESLYDMFLASYRADAVREDAEVSNAENALRRFGLEREKLNMAQATLVRALLSPEQNASLGRSKFEDGAIPRRWGKLARIDGIASPPAATRPAESN